jgi:sugar phosphate isomerase/epimerase
MSSYGIAYTSYAVRMLQGRDIMQTTAAALPAAAFIELCTCAGAAGCQIDLSQIDEHDAGALQRLRDDIERLGLFVELSIPASTIEARERFDAVVAIARALGASTFRVALLMGRRYESFPSMAAWRAFVERWRATLRHIAPAVEDAGMWIGVENHKDWLASELADLLGSVNSPHVGACVDFGNNLALLEEPLAVVSTLAPWVVTTHLKDMAVAATEEGLNLSEVPLGDGLLPLAAMIATLRRARPDVRFVLEMITRDPLPVPYRRDAYWTTREPADRVGGEQLAARLLETPHARALPQTTGLTTAAAVGLEDEHVRICTAHAKTVLGL